MHPACINIVSTMVLMKAKFLQIRIREDIKDDFQKVAELRGLSVSALIHSLIVKTIREEKQAAPEAFQVNGRTVATKSKTKFPLKGEHRARKVK